MAESKSRRSWVELLEDESDPKCTIKSEPIDEEKENESSVHIESSIQIEQNKFSDPMTMDVDLSTVKSELADPALSVKSSDPAQTGAAEMKSEPVEDDLQGAECGWSKLVESTSEEKLTPGKYTFAQICAKTSNSPTIAVSAKVEPQSTDLESPSSNFASPEKRERKRSLFPEEPKSKESFGILDDQIMESPCKDIREIMTNIHMDSPMKQDENEDRSKVRRSSPWIKSLVKSGDLRDALRSPNKDGSRKRTREHSKGVESPAHKIPHVSTSPTNKTSSPKVRGKLQYEKDKETLSRRQKQIEYGKNTLGYQRYIKLVPRETREKRHPKTPPRHLRYSRRAWDGLVKVWRQKLHFWDPPKDGEETPTELPESWDNMSDDCSASMSDTTSERSIPTTPQSGRKSNRKCSLSDSECETKATLRDDPESVSA